MIMVIYIFFSDVRPVAQQSSLCIITLENIPVLEMFEQNLELMTWLNIHKEIELDQKRLQLGKINSLKSLLLILQDEEVVNITVTYRFTVIGYKFYTITNIYFYHCSTPSYRLPTASRWQMSHVIKNRLVGDSTIHLQRLKKRSNWHLSKNSGEACKRLLWWRHR